MFYIYVDASFRDGLARIGCHIEYGYRSWNFTARASCHDSFGAEVLAVRFGLYRMMALNCPKTEFVLYSDNQTLVAGVERRRPDLAEIRNRLQFLPKGRIAWCSREMAGMRRADELAY